MPIEIRAGGCTLAADQVVACTPDLLGDAADKLGAVRVLGTGGARTARTVSFVRRKPRSRGGRRVRVSVSDAS